MRVVCCSEHWLRKYFELCEERGAVAPWPSRTALLVADGNELVAGAMMYDTTGPFVFVEHLVTNETASLTTRYLAVNLMAEEMVRFCRTSAKLPQVLVRHRGIGKILERHGLTSTGAVSMTCELTALEGPYVAKEPLAPPQHPRRVPNPAPAGGVPGRDAAQHPAVREPLAGRRRRGSLPAQQGERKD